MLFDKIVDDSFRALYYPFYRVDSSVEQITKQADGSTKISLVVPGYSKEDFSLEVKENGTLVLATTESCTNKKLQYTWTLSGDVDVKGITCECKNGILTILLQQKKKVDKSRLIEIQ